MTISEFLPIFILIFISFLCVAIAIVLSIRSRKSLLNVDDKDFIDEMINKKKKQLEMQIGGMSWKTYCLVMFISPVVLGAISYIFISPKPLCILFAFVGLFVPEVIIKLTASKQKKNFEQKYAKALKTLASSLRSGLSLEQAIKEVETNPFVDETIRKGFRQISSDIKVGISMKDAFMKFAKETDSEDAYDVAAAIALQSKVGGNEAKVVHTISQNINERIMARREMKTMFADTNVMILIMDAIPWVLLLAMAIFLPEYIKVYFESFKLTMVLIVIMAFTTIGSFIIHKIGKDAKGGVE